MRLPWLICGSRSLLAMFSRVLNWNPASLSDYEAVLKAAVDLKYDTVWTRVRPYATAGVSMSQEQHDAMHSNREGSKSDHPHSFVWHPVHEKVDDYDSPIVAIIGAGIAWDIPLRNLLPDTVSGIHAVISNNCNQSYTYFLDGPDALYVGEGDLHDNKYESDGVIFDLSRGTNPNFATTSGHCLYQLVSIEHLDSSMTKKILSLAGKLTRLFTGSRLCFRRKLLSTAFTPTLPNCLPL